MASVSVNFINRKNSTYTELEIPLDISANELIAALKEAYDLDIDLDNYFECYLVSENPIAFLKGNKLLEAYGIRNGTSIIFAR